MYDTGSGLSNEFGVGNHLGLAFEIVKNEYDAWIDFIFHVRSLIVWKKVPILMRI